MAKTKSAADQLAELERQREQIARDIKQARKDAQAERQQNDTRRKILLGSLLMNMVKKGDLSDELVQQRLDQFLTRRSERQLFKLDEDTEEKSGSTDNQGDTTRGS